MKNKDKTINPTLLEKNQKSNIKHTKTILRIIPYFLLYKTIWKFY